MFLNISFIFNIILEIIFYFIVSFYTFGNALQLHNLLNFWHIMIQAEMTSPTPKQVQLPSMVNYILETSSKLSALLP